MTDPGDIRKIEENIRQLEDLKSKGIMSAELADASIAALQGQLSTLSGRLDGDGAIAQDGSSAVGEKGVMVGGSVGGDVITGTKIEIIHKEIDKSLPFPEALKRYLENIIAAHQHLRLQGIRAGSQPLSVSLEKVYVSLTAIDKQVGSDRLKGRTEDNPTRT